MSPPVSVEGASLGSDVPVGGVPGLIPDLRGHAGWKQDHTATPKAVHSGLLTRVSAVPKPESQNSTVAQTQAEAWCKVELSSPTCGPGGERNTEFGGNK